MLNKEWSNIIEDMCHVDGSFMNKINCRFEKKTMRSFVHDVSAENKNIEFSHFKLHTRVHLALELILENISFKWNKKCWRRFKTKLNQVINSSNENRVSAKRQSV